MLALSQNALFVKTKYYLIATVQGIGCGQATCGFVIM
jgi:hypothetical protein